MFARSSHLVRLAAAAAAAAAVTLAVATTGLAAGSPSPNGTSGLTGAKATAALATLAPPPAGSEARFIGVTPCRIIDTRVSGGALVHNKRTFTAVGPYGPQGGNTAGCNIPSGVAGVMINLGALSYSSGKGWVKGWATGTTEPLASLVNYDTTGPVANMVSLPVNSSGHFDLRTDSKAHLYVDIAGYYVKPLYVALQSNGTVYGGISSGVVSTSRVGTGYYTVTFDRNVRTCAAATSDIVFATTHDVSADVGYSGDVNTVALKVTDASNTLTDSYVVLSLTC